MLECLELDDPKIPSPCGERMILIDFEVIDAWDIEIEAVVMKELELQQNLGEQQIQKLEKLE